MILAALSLVFREQSRLVRYLVEEALTVLLGIAVLLALVWITLIAFLLFWQGASFVFSRLKLIIREGTRVVNAPPHSSGPMTLQRLK